MNQKNLIVLFYLNRAKTNQKGICPIYCRITYLKKRKQFSTGEFINPSQWNAKHQNAESKTIANQQINLQLEIITANIKKTYLQLQLGGSEFSVNGIFNVYIGKPTTKEEKVIEYFRGFLNKKKRLIGIDIQMSTWKKFNYVCQQTQDYIKWKYGKNDFEYYLKTERKQKQVTINKAIQRLRKPVKEALAEGSLERDPFVSFKPGRVRKEVIFLTSDELKKLENHHFVQRRLELVKDLFIFCCYTGLAYHEMSNLKKEHIIKGFDDNEWIQMKRKKTDKLISIPLLPKPKEIIQKYNQGTAYVLPRFSNQKINSYLKEIGAIVGINKSITHHMARKTFASTVLLYNDVPMEIVSELLGHSSIKITQDYYGKVVQKRVSLEMERISRKINLQIGFS